ncbi:hypothetical protein T229_07770 [Tannerella sp. oral taxon BU063 isolate Cell 5]|uniref:Type I restriction modification DNA specificity domain-containing protein n=2 Tax=Tannerella serpentiformis TaxID=712710 RepID=W2CDT9_9BACT|nr:hypothetical protein T229_07770 [Tannerella sp. oral taxon BU063 isolate Cell 5]
MKKYRLGEIAEVIGGVTFNKADIATSGIRILRGGNIQNGEICLKEDDVYLPHIYKDNKNTILEGDTILVASTGSVGVLGKAATAFSSLGEVQIGAFLRIIRPKKTKYAALISAHLQSSRFREYIQKQAKGTSINNIRNEYLINFLLYAPNEDSLVDFSAFYHTIHHKIALNRAINHNLEAMAKQLYDYWFVQFDFPDENGKPYKSSGGKMIWNEMLKREIPERWFGENICRIADILSGGTPSKKEAIYWDNGTIPFFAPTDYSGNIFQISTEEQITEEGLVHCASSLFEKGVIIITARGSIGKLVVVGTPMAMNQSCYALQSKTEEFEYLYFLTRQLIESLKAKGSGSVFKSIIASDIENSWLCIGSDEVVSVFCNKVKPIFESIKENTLEIAVLTKQRDEFLPLLMNGQASLNYDLSHD